MIIEQKKKLFNLSKPIVFLAYKEWISYGYIGLIN